MVWRQEKGIKKNSRIQRRKEVFGRRKELLLRMVVNGCVSCVGLGSLCVYDRQSWYIAQESSGGKREWWRMGGYSGDDSDERC
jgi:hypothetical protein